MHIVQSNVAFVPEQDDVKTAIEIMRERNISSVLCVDTGKRVTGILTERDIVQKLSLVGSNDATGRKIAALMSKPVRFARIDHLVEDVAKLHFEHRIRHFPVVRDPKDQSAESVVGIMSITDIARNFLHDLVAPRADAAKPGRIALHVVAHDEAAFGTYRGIFTALGYDVLRIESVVAIPALPKPPARAALLVDMDGYPVHDLEQMLAAVRGVKLPIVFATSRRELLEPFKKNLAGTRRDIALKPVDVSYCHWALMNWLR